MQRDIRMLFQTDKEVDFKELPKQHRTEFLEKLKKQNRKPIAYKWLSVAAIVLIAMTVMFNVYYSPSEDYKEAPIVAQIESVEKEYLKNIEAEWQSFVALAEDEVLVERFRKKLDDLDADYQETSNQFKEDNNNILVIENLVENLQTRLQLLKDIQNHIKILNQNNEQHENTI